MELGIHLLCKLVTHVLAFLFSGICAHSCRPGMQNSEQGQKTENCVCVQHVVVRVLVVGGGGGEGRGVVRGWGGTVVDLIG